MKAILTVEFEGEPWELDYLSEAIEQSEGFACVVETKEINDDVDSDDSEL